MEENDQFTFDDEPFDNTGVIVETDDGRTIGYGEYVVEFGIDQDGDGLIEGMLEDPDSLGLFFPEAASETLDERTGDDDDKTATVLSLVQYDPAAYDLSII